MSTPESEVPLYVYGTSILCPRISKVDCKLTTTKLMFTVYARMVIGSKEGSSVVWGKCPGPVETIWLGTVVRVLRKVPSRGLS